MGPLRRRLTLALAVLLLAAPPALAEVCATLRPGWNASVGPVTWLQEIGRVLASFPGLVILASLAFGLWRPHPWISAACALPAFAMAGMLAMYERAETASLARAEGCIATVLPAALLLVALGAFTIVRAWRRG